uniref:CSON007872 protein n=1 Tax=Culicoides sonorensis TaxID=179676 RepID=A0A336MYY9_CULSO
MPNILRAAFDRVSSFLIATWKYFSICVFIELASDVAAFCSHFSRQRLYISAMLNVLNIHQQEKNH